MKRLSSTTLRLAVAPESGADATIYWLVPSVTQVKRKADGTHLPEYVSCESISKTGNSAPVKGIGTIKFLFVYKTGSMSQEFIYSSRIIVTSDIASISFRLYLGAVLVDSKAVVVVDDGIKGDSGLPGPAGQKGQLVCPAGFWLNNVTYTATKDYTPLVYYEAGKTYYVLNKLGDYVGINPADDYGKNGVNATWIPFQNYKAIFTEMLMANFGKLSSAVFYGEYMFSQQGIDINGNPTSNYSLFDPEKIGAADCPFTPNVLINFLTGKIISLELDARGGQIGGLRIDELKGISLKVANMKVGGRNLILNSNQIINIDSSIGLNWAYMNLSTSNLNIGKTYILTCDNKTISGHLIPMLSDGMWSNNQIIEFNKPFVLQQLNTKFSITNDGAVGVASLSHIKLEAGNMPTDWSPAPEDLASKKELEDTGIDIYNKKIQFTADNAVFRDNSGKEMGVFKNGSFNAELINTDTLTAKTVQTATSGARVEVMGSELKVFGDFELPNIIMGVRNGYAILSYYGNNGQLLYDLGPKGIDWGSIKPASWGEIKYQPTLLLSTSIEKPSFRDLGGRNMIEDRMTTFYTYYAGSNPSLTQADRDKEKYTYATKSLGNWIGDGWYLGPSRKLPYDEYDVIHDTSRAPEPDEISEGWVSPAYAYFRLVYKSVDGIATRTLYRFVYNK